MSTINLDRLELFPRAAWAYTYAVHPDPRPQTGTQIWRAQVVRAFQYGVDGRGPKPGRGRRA